MTTPIAPKPMVIPEVAKVKLTKRSSSNRPAGSLDDGYCIEGILMTPIEVGRAIKVWRQTLNGVKVHGVLSSTPIRQLVLHPDHAIIYTQHSTWELRISS